MDLKKLLDQDDAVSPVIGVILMVAITVILAAVIATFVLGLGDNLSNTAPQASFGFDYADDATDELTIVHEGGDSIEQGELDAAVSGAQKDGGTGGVTYTSDLFSDGTTKVSAGDSEIINKDDFDGSGDLDLSGATVRVIYSSSDGGSSATLGKWEGPSA